jgi:hypothetical protein
MKWVLYCTRSVHALRPESHRDLLLKALRCYYFSYTSLEALVPQIFLRAVIRLQHTQTPQLHNHNRTWGVGSKLGGRVDSLLQRNRTGAGSIQVSTARALASEATQPARKKAACSLSRNQCSSTAVSKISAKKSENQL